MNLLKHVKNKDVALEVLESVYLENIDTYEVFVRWWNIGECHEPMCMNIMETVKIKGSDMPNWRPYSKARA